MKKPDLLGWDAGLTEDQVSLAMAAAGVLFQSLRYYPFEKDDADWLESRLREAPTTADGTLTWANPGFERRYERHTSQRALADAWRHFVSGGKRPTLEIEVPAWDRSFLEHALWYVAQLRRDAVHAASVYLHHEPQGFPVDWQWPLRISFVPDAMSEAAEEKFRALAGSGSWLEHIVRVVDAKTSASPVDLLVFAQGSRATETLLDVPAAVRAHACVLLGLSTDQQEEALLAVESLFQLTLASGVILADFDPVAPQDGLAPLVRELSHNHTLAVALQHAASHGGSRPADAVLVSSPDLLRAARVSEFGLGLAEKLSSLGPQAIKIDHGAGGHLGLGAGAHPADTLGQELQGKVHAFHFMAESEEATTISKLSAAAAALPAAKPEESPPTRFLQYQLEGDQRLNPMGSSGALYRDEDHTLRVRIGGHEQAWGQANKGFPEEDLPRKDGGHLLTVVFSEPEVVPSPMVSSLFLPPAGPSTACQFQFHVGPEVKTFRGRITVLYENRILQSALLEGDVTVRGEKLPELRFTIETVVVPQMGGLDARKRYTAAILTNQSAKGSKQALCVRGFKAALVNLGDVAVALEDIKRTLDDCPWEDMEKCTLSSEPELNLLRGLAGHGRLLYDALVEDAGLLPAMQGSGPVQLIAANADAAHLPVEFCYVREPPASTAGLCPRISAGLQSAGSFRWEDCRMDCDEAKDESSVVCPWAFWALNRVIEWHRFDSSDRLTMRGADYALQSERTAARPKLSPLEQILLAASKKVKPTAKEIARTLAAASTKSPGVAGTWTQWKTMVGRLRPTLMVLLVHTEPVQNTPSMEINGKLLDPPYVSDAIVKRPGDDTPPVVLLLGCGTGVADVGFYRFPAQFRRKGAAIVVSTVAELLDDHAPALAQRIVEALRPSAASGRTFGEVMLTVKRQCVLAGQPIAMALVSYGDADWEV